VGSACADTPSLAVLLGSDHRGPAVDDATMTAAKNVDSAADEVAASTCLVPASTRSLSAVDEAAVDQGAAEDGLNPLQSSADAEDATFPATSVAAQSEPLRKQSSPEGHMNQVLDSDNRVAEGDASGEGARAETIAGAVPMATALGEGGGVTGAASEDGLHNQEAPGSAEAGVTGHSPQCGAAEEGVLTAAAAGGTARLSAAEEAQALPTSPAQTIPGTAVSPTGADVVRFDGAEEGEESGRCDSAASFDSDGSADCARLAETFDRKDTRFSVYVPEQQDT
jgi:hypothetical protein